MKIINYYGVSSKQYPHIVLKKGSIHQVKKRKSDNVLPEANLFHLPHVVLYKYTQQPTSHGQSYLPSHA